ncbi:MAG: methyltransferase [Phenylobacterium sp.]|uniref:methyltransferase n=1 Tax=Phenylobacterium sp. TaxID=1871053 RepID=UPI002600E15B|nr:methyltransferase [Phenylobacterium sp.]MBA4013920.1 methyltransferase [Phenylobacterium sp.]
MDDARPITPEAIMQLGWGFWGSKTLLSAVELGVFTELGNGPLGLEALTSRLSLHPRSARDFFDALVALGVLARDGSVYANTPETALFLDRNKPTYVGGILEMANKRLYRFWDGLTEALRTGLPQNEAKDGGEDLFGVIYADPVILESFLRGMTGVSLPAAQAMAALFPWNEVKSLVDVGCAQGGATATIALAHPHLAATGFDLAVVQPVFDAYVKEKGLADRVRFAAGDFFAGSLPSADVIIMGHILHDWNLAQKRELLAKAYAALPDGGRLIVYDAIIDDARRQNAFGLLMSLNMLIETNGGFDYTGADCIGWMKEAGFREAVVQPLAGPDSMVIGTK